MLKKRVRKPLTKKSIYFASLIVVLSLTWHIAHVSPRLPQITYAFSINSVSIKIDGRESRNIPIQPHGLPGTLVLDEGFMFFAFVNLDSYWAVEHTSPIIETFPSGMTISVLPVFVTAGPFTMMIDEQQVMNREHDPTGEGKAVLINTHYTNICYINGRRFIFG